MLSLIDLIIDQKIKEIPHTHFFVQKKKRKKLLCAIKILYIFL